MNGGHFPSMEELAQNWHCGETGHTTLEPRWVVWGWRHGSAWHFFLRMNGLAKHKIRSGDLILRDNELYLWG